MQLSNVAFQDYFSDFSIQDTEENRYLLSVNLEFLELQKQASMLTAMYPMYHIPFDHRFKATL